MSNLGLCGAHRTGKTTLAIALSESLNIPFVSIDTTDIFKRFHINPSKPMDIRTRMMVQEKILEYACETWFEMDTPFICDRAPIDMMAYTLSEVGGATLDEQLEVQLKNYLKRCRTATIKYFEHLFLIPPAIPIIFEEGKASLSEGYISHIHLLCTGLFYESDVDGFRIKKECIDLFERVQKISRYLYAVGFINELKND